MSKLRNFLINQYNVNILMGIDTPSVIEIDNMVFNVTITAAIVTVTALAAAIAVFINKRKNTNVKN